MMNPNKSSNGLIGAGVISAVAASLCCITPILALIAGSSGIASSFSWLEPARPFLIGITVFVLGFAWYQKLKSPKKEAIDCACDDNEKRSFLKSKLFLGIVTVFAGLMLAFPYYAHIFYQKTESNVVNFESGNVVTARFEVSGMTCRGCEEHIINAVSKLQGILKTTASHETGKAIVKYDKSKITVEQIVFAINETGYKITKQEFVQNQK